MSLSQALLSAERPHEETRPQIADNSVDAGGHNHCNAPCDTAWLLEATDSRPFDQARRHKHNCIRRFLADLTSVLYPGAGHKDLLEPGTARLTQVSRKTPEQDM